MFAILKRELSSYFSSPVGYVVTAVFMSFSGFFFYVQCLNAGTSSMYSVFQSMFFIVLFVIPLITMRLFCEDRKYKTDQALLTAPVSIPAIVIAKYLSALTMLLICLSSYIIEGLALTFISSPDWSVIFGNVLAMVMMGSAFIAIGLFISSLTENIVIAAIGSFAVNVIISMIDSISSTMTVPFFKSILESLSFQSKYSNFALGIVSLSDIVFFISIAAMFLLFTERVIERRRWA